MGTGATTDCCRKPCTTHKKHRRTQKKHRHTKKGSTPTSTAFAAARASHAAPAVPYRAGCPGIMPPQLCPAGRRAASQLKVRASLSYAVTHLSRGDWLLVPKSQTFVRHVLPALVLPSAAAPAVNAFSPFGVPPVPPTAPYP